MTQHLAHPDTIVIAKQAGKQYEVGVQFNNFTDGDTHCLIESTEHISGGKILIRHYLYPNQNEQVMRLLLLVGTLKNIGARSIEVFTPCLPYARQDKAHFPGEAVAAELLCRILHQAGVEVLHTIDCHFMKGAPTATVEGLVIENILVQSFLINHAEQLLGNQNYHIIGPDAGAAYLAHGETMKKARAKAYDQDTAGAINRNVASLEDTHLRIHHDIVVVADDMVSTGGTMIKALENLQARDIKNLYAMTTHGFFLKGSFDTISSLVAGLFYSDTIPLAGAVPVVEAVFETIRKQL